MTTGLNDNEIISKVLSGDHQAYAGLVNRYQNYVFTLTLRMVKNREDAEEVAQDVFIKAYRSLADFRGSIVGTRPKVRNQDKFPFEAKQRHYLVKIFHKWDDPFLCAITKDCDGKFDGWFIHWLTTKSSQDTRSGSIAQPSSHSRGVA